MLKYSTENISCVKNQQGLEDKLGTALRKLWDHIVTTSSILTSYYLSDCWQSVSLTYGHQMAVLSIIIY